jgi:hypothetical protein
LRIPSRRARTSSRWVEEMAQQDATRRVPGDGLEAMSSRDDSRILLLTPNKFYLTNLCIILQPVQVQV